MVDLARARTVAVSAATDAGRLLLERIDTIREVRHKGAVDLVTDVDIASEQLIRACLQEAFPDHTIVGEEGGTVAGTSSDARWFIDPLDGTTNYAHGFPFFSVSIGLELFSKLVLGVVFAPVLDELFVAEDGHGATLNDRPIGVSATTDLRQSLLATGFPYDHANFPRALQSFERLSLRSQAVRRAGSAALDLSYVACGRFDGYWEHEVMPWDMAAGALVVLEAGGVMTTTDGSPFGVEAGSVVATNGEIHPAVLAALAGT